MGNYRLLLTCATFLVLLTGAHTMASPQRPGPPSAMADVENKASLAKSGDHTAVRAFVNAVFDSTMFSGLPESVRLRVTNAEVRFLRGEQAPISESSFVSVVNQMVRDAAVAEHLVTSSAQVHQFRHLMRQLSPNSVNRARGSMEMSPAEAAFVLVHLTSQKLINPDYKVPPGHWVRSLARERDQSDGSKNPIGPRVEIRKKNHADSTEVLEMGIRSGVGEASALAVAAHQFLDAIGVQR